MTPTIGRIVHYTLTSWDATQINERRDDAHRHLVEHRERADGSVVHFGNSVLAGDTFPMVIVRVWNEEPGTVNGQVLLDGNDALWVTSVTPSDEPSAGHYNWPARV